MFAPFLGLSLLHWVIRMVEYDIHIEDVPVGDTAIAHVVNRESGAATDVDSVQAEWFDQDGTKVEDLTYSGTDVTGTGVNGEASSIEKESDGKYKLSLAIDSTYSIGSFPKAWQLVVTVTDSSVSDSSTFNFLVVESEREVLLRNVATIEGSDNLLTRAIKRESGLLETFSQTVSASRNKLSFNEGIVYAIDKAFKNGGRFEQGATGDTYGWNKYTPWVDLNTTTSEGDHFYFLIQTKLEDEALQSIIDNAQNLVISTLAPYYSSATDLKGTPTVLNIIKDLVVGEVRQLFSAGVALESSQFRVGMDRKEQAKKLMKSIQRGGANVLKDDDTALSRETGALVGGPINAGLDRGDVEDLMDRVVDWNPFAFNFYDLVEV